MDKKRMNHPINLAYDVTILASGLEKTSNRGGIFFVALSVLRELVKRGDVRVYLYCQEFYKEAVREYLRLNPIPYLPNPIQYIDTSACQYLEAFLSPVFKVPEDLAIIHEIKKYIILHDAIPFRFPQYYPDMDKGYWLKELVESMCLEAAYFTVSSNTKKDFLDLRPDLKEDQFITIYLGADEFKRQRSEESRSKIFMKYGLPLDKNYVLALCSLEERKNIVRIAESFCEFVKEHKIIDLCLILAGAYKRDNQRLNALIDENDCIYLTGYIDDEERSTFYSNAEWFIYTSQYEGFGMPVLEAMSCGCPVIASNNSSLPEIVGEAGTLINCDSTKEHLNAYESYYFRPEYREYISQKSLERAKKFSWKKTVDRIVGRMNEDKKLNIAFDATAVCGPMSKNRGIGNYATSLFTTLINMDQVNRYFMLNVFEKSELNSQLREDSNFCEQYFYCGKDNQLLKEHEFENVLGSIVKRFLYDNHIDVFIITSPFENQILPYRTDWFEGVKIVAIVYDIIPYLFQKKYFGDINVNGKWYLDRLEVLKGTDLCLTISDSAKEDLVRHAGFDRQKIRTIWGAADKKFRVMELAQKDIDIVLERYDIHGEYLMCTGGDDDRKNLDALICAYAQMPGKLIDRYMLVIVCRMSDNSLSHYRKLIKDQGVEGRVVITGFVSDEELVLLYNAAHLMAFPSIYEGFGLPIVEAFACQTPVLTSNNSSLVEVAGDAAVLVDPYNIEDISNGLVRALTQEDLDALTEMGNRRLELFQWEKVAESMLNGITDLQVEIVKKAFRTIAIFTPMPPARSGIADYAYDVIGELSQYFDIDIYIDGGYEIDCELPSNVRYYIHSDFASNYSRYDEIIYEVGNSVFHRYMWDYIDKYPGIVELHDGNLHSVVFTIANQENDYGLYETILGFDYDKKEVNEYIKQLRLQKIAPRIEKNWINGFVVNRSKKVIVHNRYLQEKLLNRNVMLDVSCIRHYAKIRVDDSFQVEKERLGFSTGDIIIGIFGMVASSKKIKEALEAFCYVAKHEPRLKLAVVGGYEPSDDYIRICKDYIIENGIANKVLFTGYVHADLMEMYINICDICLNMRYHYKGESSGTMAHMMAQAKCVIVNDIGDFAELPDDVCLKLPYREDREGNAEIKEVAAAIEKLLDTDMRERIGINAKKYVVEQLNLGKIGREYYECIVRPAYPSLSEKAAGRILDRGTDGERYKREELEALVDTLVYAKGY